MSANTSNSINVISSLVSTDFNVVPYNDDYDIRKQFHRILARPGFPVQAREFTQVQTILQNQIMRFGQHIFREGSIVLPGQFGIETKVPYVKINDFDNANTAVDINEFTNEVVTGATNGIKAYVIEVADGSQASANTKTLYVRYLDSAPANSAIQLFQAGEPLTSNVGNLVVGSANSTGFGSRFIISQGIVFAKGHFVYFPSQSTILTRYDSVPTCKVGFLVEESIVTPDQDASLLDPALGSSNYQAPGSHRFKLAPTLEVLDIDSTAGPPDFVELFTIQDGVIQEIFEKPQYSIILDAIAKRTEDQSGDFYVKGLTVRVRENYDNGSNGGLDANGNTQFLSVGVEPGLAYVKGYEISKLVTTYVSTPKATDFRYISDQITSATMGNWIRVNEFTGFLNMDQGNQVTLYNTAMRRITNNLWSAGAQTGSPIGTARVKSIIYDSGILGTPTGNVAIYLTNIKMNATNSFANVRSVYQSTTAPLGGDVVLDASNNAILQDSTIDTLLYYTGSPATRSIRSSQNFPDVIYTFERTTDVSILTDGTVAIAISTPASANEAFPYGTTTLSEAQKYDLILTIDTDVSLNLVGTVSGNSGANTITGSATQFTRLNAGDKLAFANAAGPTGVYTITTITDATHITLNRNLAGAATANTLQKVYKQGDIIDLHTKGSDAGTERTVSATPSTLSFNLQETFGGTKAATLTYQVTRTSAREINKTLSASRYVVINVASHPAGTTGPYGLGIADIYRINQIRTDTSAFASNSQGTLHTDDFQYRDGQQDSFYDHGSIVPQSLAISNNMYILVELDVFTSVFTQGTGFFSVDSYPVNDSIVSSSTIRTENIPIYTSPDTGIQYDLKDFLDFRPVKANTAVLSSTVAGASVNPANSSTFTYETNGLRLPVPSAQVIYDYSYYYARRDLVVMDKDGNINVVEGITGDNTVTPTTPDNSMALASLYIAPYPSLAPNYAQTLNRRDLGIIIAPLSNIRQTMKDIGAMKKRIINLEYYASISALQQSAVDMQILDENGLNRFKNGIFADSFRDHTLADFTNADYNIVVDPAEKVIRPIYTMDSFEYDVVSTSGVTETGDLITLPFTETILINQPHVTTTRNVELSSYRFIGRLTLTPDQDMWVDTEQAEDNAITLGPDGENLPQPTAPTWNAWQTKVVGYNLYNANDPNHPVLIAHFDANQRDLAFNNAAWLARRRTIGNNTLGQVNGFSTALETIYEDTRTGTQTFSGLSTSTQTVGENVIDVSLIPYIQPQTILLSASGLKANTRLYTYFDGEAMSSYVTPLTETQYNTGWPFSTGTEGTALTSNKDGNAFAALRLPIEKRFRVGSKEVILTDNINNSQEDSASSASAYFVAQGLVQTKQNTILTTRQIIQFEQEVNATQHHSTQQVTPFRESCSAYSFLVKAPNGTEGVFLSSADLYFAAKHSNLGVWVEIREMNNAGGITRNQVPFSEVHLDVADINISDDASEVTNIAFPSPVFLYNDVQYAFIIHTVGLNPDTAVWISRLGETDLNTGSQVTSRPLTGTFFTTNNNLNWDIVPDVDLMVTFYRAAFTTGVEGQVVIGNEPVEKVLLSAVSVPLTNYGEAFVGNDILTLSSVVGSIIVGDKLIGQTSNANTSVLVIAGSDYTMGNTGYSLNETVSVANANGTIYSGRSASVSSIARASGRLLKYTTFANTKVAEFVSSNGKFRTSDVLHGVVTHATANVSAINNYRYDTIDFEPGFLNFNDCSIDFEMETTSNGASPALAGFTSIVDNNNYDFNSEQALLSRTNEIASISSSPSNQVRVSMESLSEYVSPVLDMRRTHTVYVNNYVNSNTANETLYTGGALLNKYISKPVTLTQTAEDVRVILAAYRPPDTDVLVWIRILSGEDINNLSTTGWIALEKVDDTAYSSSSNKKDFKDFTFKFPDSVLTGSGGEVQYTSPQGIVYTGYLTFQVKVGLSSDDSSNVPKVGDLRVISLLV